MSSKRAKGGLVGQEKERSLMNLDALISSIRQEVERTDELVPSAFDAILHRHLAPWAEVMEAYEQVANDAEAFVRAVERTNATDENDGDLNYAALDQSDKHLALRKSLEAINACVKAQEVTR
jgi:hypothetical protein